MNGKRRAVDTFPRLIHSPEQLRGAGPLTPLLVEPDVTDVLVNGVEVWVDRGGGLQRTPMDLGGAGEVRRLAQRLPAGPRPGGARARRWGRGLGGPAGGRRDDASRGVDAQLSDGTRMHAVRPPIARGGPYLSL